MVGRILREFVKDRGENPTDGKAKIQIVLLVPRGGGKTVLPIRNSHCDSITENFVYCREKLKRLFCIGENDTL